MMNDISIKLDSVSKFYKLYDSPRDRLKEALNPFGKLYHNRFYALNNISLEIKKGEVLGIVGRNGCGKSTLLKLIAGVLTTNGGEVKVNGKISALLELGSGFNPEFTGIQNIFFYGAVLGFSREEMDEMLEDIVSFAEIGGFIHQPLKTYSSGMKSRLGFAVAIAVDPDILIVDEVLAVGDLLFQRKCYNKIHDLFNDGKTVIFVSHNSQIVTQFCNRVVLLQDGSIVRDGEPKDIMAAYEKILFSKTSNIDTNDGQPEKEISGIRNYSNSSDGDDSCTEQSNKHLGKIYDVFVYGEDVNLISELKRGSVYIIEFKIKFNKSFNRVSPGVQIKNMQGFLVSGANLWDYQQENISCVHGNDVIKVKCQFKCMLVPGAYTVALSSSSERDEELLKLPDAFIFKVQPDKKINGGIVGLEQKITVEKM